MQHKNIEELFREDIYKIIDSFLVEAKDQNGNERSLERLNADRHLAVEAIIAFLLSAYNLGIEKSIEVAEGFKVITPDQQPSLSEDEMDIHNTVLSSLTSSLSQLLTSKTAD